MASPIPWYGTSQKGKYQKDNCLWRLQTDQLENDCTSGLEKYCMSTLAE